MVDRIDAIARDYLQEQPVKDAEVYLFSINSSPGQIPTARRYCGRWYLR